MFCSIAVFVIHNTIHISTELKESSCDYQVTQKGNLKTHQVSIHQCDECDYQATEKGSLKLHKKSNRGLKYACSLCDYQATGSRTRHRKSNHSHMCIL